MFETEIVGEAQTRDDELLVGIGELPTSTNFKPMPALAFGKGYLGIEGGFAAANGSRPVAIVKGLERPGSSLEKRWLLSRIREKSLERFSVSQTSAYVGSDAQSWHLSLAEDIYTEKFASLLERDRSHRVLIDEKCNLKKIDPHREARIKHQLGFRRWVDANPDQMTSVAIAEQIGDFATKHGLWFEAMDRSRLESEGMNLLLAVGQASTRSPSKLILAAHGFDPTKGESPDLVLVGKGITFDTGGINVKHHDFFVNAMKNDMAGAALTTHLFMALVEAGVERKVMLAVPTCENLVAEKAMKPGSVVRSHRGHQVFIEHTDAEGRLILADALSYVDRHYKPKEMISIATLTTAALRQFSNYYTPVHFASREFQSKLLDSADRWGEGYTFWDHFLPFTEANLTEAADFTNMGRMPKDSGIGGGSNVAAHFLHQFCDAPLTHIDIFATTWNWSKEYPGAGFGATGAPFNSLFDCLAS